MKPIVYNLPMNKETKQRIIAMRRIQLQKLSEIKRGLYEEGFWIPKK